MPNLATCTPAELRNLLGGESRLEEHQYLCAQPDGTLFAAPGHGNDFFSDAMAGRLKFSLYIPSRDGMPVAEAIDDDMMNVFLREARQAWASNKFGLVD